MAQNFCKSCGAELIPGKEFCPTCLIRVPPVVNKKQYPEDTPENRAKRLKEYKVIGTEEEWFLGSGGRINRTFMEDTLNSYASDGWIVKEVIARQIPGFGSLTYESIVILERDMPLVP